MARYVGEWGVLDSRAFSVREGPNASVSRVEYPVLGDRTLRRENGGYQVLRARRRDTRVECDASALAPTLCYS
jgi:hypothetical protein